METPAPQLNHDHTDRAQYIATQMAERLKWSLSGQKWWSFATHGATVLIVICSSTAAVLAQVDTTLLTISGKTWATMLSLLVTIISTTQSKLGFEKKWIANRMTQSELSQLDIDRNMGEPPEKLSEKLKQIVAKHDQAITSDVS